MNQAKTKAIERQTTRRNGLGGTLTAARRRSSAAMAFCAATGDSCLGRSSRTSRRRPSGSAWMPELTPAGLRSNVRA
jgi:hypothetical protein